MSSTHEFKLPSGVMAEVTEMVGKHQKMLTRQDKRSLAEKLNDVIKDVTVRIGSVTNKEEIAKIVDSMLSCDKKKILIEARQFSMDFPKEFDFVYEYINSENKEEKYEMKLNLEEAFKMKLLKDQYEEYRDVVKEVAFTLPRSKREVVWTMMDSKADAKAMKYKKEDLSSHTPIELRNPRERKETTMVKLN